MFSQVINRGGKILNRVRVLGSNDSRLMLSSITFI